jgi:hypothetical protein
VSKVLIGLCHLRGMIGGLWSPECGGGCWSIRISDPAIKKYPKIIPMWTTTVFSLARRCAALAPLLFVTACNQPTVRAPEAQPAGEWHTFEGTWSASGTRQTLNLEADHRALTFDLTGSMLLMGDRGIGVGFRAKAIGFSDSLTGMQGRCVWTDERGDKVYSELKGEWVGTGNRIVGTFLGGTGRFADITGEYSFQWVYVVESEDGSVSGRAVNLKGRARFGSMAVTPDGEQPK